MKHLHSLSQTCEIVAEASASRLPARADSSLLIKESRIGVASSFVSLLNDIVAFLRDLRPTA